MKKLYLLIIMLPFLPYQAEAGAQEKSLSDYSKEENMFFAATDYSGINISNRHGDISVSAWEKDSVKIDISITVKGKKEKEAEEVLEEIEINQNETKDIMQVSTEFGEDFYSSHEFHINYEIHLPANYLLNLSNQFGNIELSSVTGGIEIDLEYGELIQKGSNLCESISGSLSFVEAEMGSFKNVNMTLHNTNIEFQDITENGDFKGRYCQISLQNSNTLNINTSTSRITAREVNDLTLNGDFCFTSINEIIKNGRIEIDNGMLIIHSISQRIDELRINNSNAPINLGLPPSLAYTLHGEVTNGQFRHYKAQEFRIIKDMNKISFSGSIKDQDNGASIVLFNKDAGIHIGK